jgi:hypothetical protein
MWQRWAFRVVLVLLVLVECFLVFAAFSESHVDKPGTGSAWYAWRQHPSPETEAAWNAERRKLGREEAIVAVTNWLLIIATGAGLYYLIKRQKSRV